MNHYKSWSALNKQLSACLCELLKDRITYFLTRYHKVHNSYGRVSIRLDGEELVNFSWVEMYHQDEDIHALWEATGIWTDQAQELKDKWDAEGEYSDYDFLSAATEFLQLSIKDALNSENYIIRIFAIMDKRVGRRTLEKIWKEKDYQKYPRWIRQFYELRLEKYQSFGEEYEETG